jgi:hypothetical protein
LSAPNPQAKCLYIIEAVDGYEIEAVDGYEIEAVDGYETLLSH